MIDAHLYVLSRWTLDLLEAEKKNISSLKSELVPFLAKRQFSKPDAIPITLPSHPWEHAFALSHSARALEREKDLFRCQVYVMGTEGGYCCRANTVHDYAEMNFTIAKGGQAYLPLEPNVQARDKSMYFLHPSAVVDPRSTVGPECVLGQDSKMGERTSIKKSVIGRHCVLGSNVKVVSSVIMDHVTIADGCTIQGSIICNNAHLHERVSLKDCYVGSSYTISADSNVKGEALCRERD